MKNHDDTTSPHPTRVALGKSGGLGAFAEAHGATWYEELNLGELWKSKLRKRLENEGTEILVCLDGVSPADVVAVDLKEHTPTDCPFYWELRLLKNNPAIRKRTRWYRGKQLVVDPFDVKTSEPEDRDDSGASPRPAKGRTRSAGQGTD
ncbi:MAG: hypothetical protein EP330_13780 [Deltaproteobacteria bacterium]|nr:MAG: hypothetical protein EP330_13780 [Deltaproteobacteria bacterium]